MYQKLGPDPFLILVNNPKQPFYARNSIKNKYFKGGLLSKALKIPTLLFLLNLLMDKIFINKYGTSSQCSSGYETSSG